MRTGLLAAGNWIIDHVKMIDRWPDQDTLANIESVEKGTGGSPYNLLVSLARLKTPFPLEALGLVGKDSNGEFILEDCKSHMIDTRQLAVIGTAPTSFTDVMTVRNTGRRTFFHNPGANALLAPEHFAPQNTSCRIFHLGYLLLLNSLDQLDSQFGTKASRVLASYRAAGLKTSVDVVSELSNRFVQLVLPAMPHTDYLILNELEAGHCTGQLTREGEEIKLDGVRKAATELIAKGVQELVAIHFPEGAYARTRDGREFLQGSLNLPGGYIKGTVGAGDAFCAGMLLGLHENWKIEDCLKLAVSNAAACLAHSTSTGGIRPLNETLSLFEQFGARELS